MSDHDQCGAPWLHVFEEGVCQACGLARPRWWRRKWKRFTGEG